MNRKPLKPFITVLVGLILFSACSPLEISKIEKRRYRDGYFVQMKHGTEKRTTPELVSINTPSSVDHKEQPGPKKRPPKLIEAAKQVQEAVQGSADTEELSTILANPSSVRDQLQLWRSNKSLASIAVREMNTSGISKPTDPKGGVVAVLLLLILLAFGILFLLVSWTLIVVIAVAVVIGIVLSVILKAVGLIGD